jgi:hypothetical protein
MARRTVPVRRVVVSGEGGARRTILASAGGALDELALDDRPLAVALSVDARHLIVTLPHELWIVDAKSLAVQRTIALSAARPSVAEGWEGALWIGGPHLHRASIHSTATTKIGSKLGGYVDHVALIRDDLLCCVGSAGELLWDIDREGPTHKRKSPGPGAIAVVASTDGRGVFCDGSETTWVIDPAHPAGYAQLRMSQTSPVSVPSEAIVCIGRTPADRGGRVLLGARDGAIAWTTHDLRLAGERVPTGKRDSTPLAMTGDERWIYVLRGRGILQRFLIAQPQPPKRPDKKRPPLPGQQVAPEPPPLPDAQEVRLDKLAECMALIIEPSAVTGPNDPVEPAKRILVLGGGRADGALGRLWMVDPDALEWQDLALSRRVLAEPPPPPDPNAEPPPPQRPSFIATKNKLSGPKISAIAVDDIVNAHVEYWLTPNTGSLLERPTERRPKDEILPGDALLLPAMVRFSEGTARPALLLWPGVVEDHAGPPPDTSMLVWGDDPRAWMALETPEIRLQKWSRTDVFPIQVALASVPTGVPGKRSKIDPKWVDREHFEALAKECKKLLKVLW